jgi:autotransporter-associated beta strand protein
MFGKPVTGSTLEIMKPRPRHILTLSTLLLCPLPLQAQTTLNWTGGAEGTGNNLSTVSSWTPNQAPSATTDLVIATRNGDGEIPTIVFGGSYSVRSIAADNLEGRFSSTFGLRLVSSTLSSSTIERTITFTEGGIPIWTAANNAILRFQQNSFLTSSSILNLDLNYTGFGIVDVDSTSTIRVVSGNIRGTGGVQKTGAGVLSIENAGTYTGGVRILGGVLSVNSPGGLGAAPSVFVADQVVIDGGTLRFDNASLASSSSRGFQIGSNGGTIEVLTSSSSILGVMSGTGQLTKSGGFILGLNAANTYSGGTLIAQGRVTFNNGSSFGTGLITMDNGTGIYTTVSGTEISNDMLLKGGNRLGNTATTLQSYHGDIDLNGGTQEIRVSSQVTLGGSVSNGGLTLEIDSGAQLTLDGDNSYSGPTTVTAGVLVVNGSNASTSTTIESGATLRGSGSLDGLTTVAGTLSIGNSPGTMTFMDLSFTAGSNFTYEVVGGDTEADLGLVSGMLDLGGAILDLVQLGSHTIGDKFTLFGYNSLNGTFDGLGQGDGFSAGGGVWEIDYFDTSAGLNGGSGTNFVTITAIPEPKAALLGGLGLLALLRRRRHS